MRNETVLSFRIVVHSALIVAALCQFGAVLPAIAQTPDVTTNRNQACEALLPVANELQALVQKHYPKAKFTVTRDNVHFEHRVKMRSTYYGDRPETLYQGIYGDITIGAGKYAQTTREMPGESRNIVDTTLFIMPFCRPKNAHLAAKLVFPDDVSPEFKEQYIKIIKGFASDEPPTPGSAAAKAEADAAAPPAPPVAAAPAEIAVPPVVTTPASTTTTTTEASRAPSKPKGPLPYFAKPDASGLPSNVFILEAQQLSPAHDVPAGSYWLWTAKKAGGDHTTWDWQRHGPYACDTATRYVIHNSASVFCKAESDGNLATIKGGLARICVQNPLGQPYAFILDNTIDASLRNQPKQ